MKRGTMLAGVLALALPLGGCATAPEAPPATASSVARPLDLPDALQAGWQGKPACELLHQDAVRRVLRCSFAPGTGHERHFHPPNVGYALSGGTMRITTAAGTRDVVLATGSSFSSAGETWHEVLNIGDTTVAYLIFEEIAAAPR